MAIAVADEALEARLRARLASVEIALAQDVRSRAPFVAEAASHLMAAGGKRFRPLLVLLAAECGPRTESADVEVAARAVELVHLASLYHDDVMDEALVRRSADSANARYDNRVAILTGDWLFARSSELTAQLGPEAVRIQAETFGRLVEGQILEGVTPTGDAVEHHLEVVAGKTGALLATSARYGAMFSGASAEIVAALTEYGELIGTAFQLSDDILDIASDESGKTPGTDLREGVPTLPTLLARANGETAVLDALAGDLTQDAPLAAAVAVLRESKSLQAAREYVIGEAERAKAVLSVVPDGSVRTALVAFADAVATRTR
ncbi:geranylgeranyl pyrophosphate synthase [Nocardioides baekrokdamisoli]|uniref:Geranylgeranyl pyrophosphate synthase n=1 Tax=Nocardioides baekrokdamisoli TaxID=1804624 RepID=A0A3G9IP75_9ACTN|nr:geranylgeranyl pyrophosphate synthase [Nocardioides baekrokdamisoli]